MKLSFGMDLKEENAVREAADYQHMFHELTSYEKNQVDLVMEGAPASPMQIVNAHMMCEDSGYMRDYVLNDNGDVKELWFNLIKKENK